MTRRFRFAFFLALHLTFALAAVTLKAQQKPAASPSQLPKAMPPEESLPPEEDESIIPEKVPFNPMESDRSIEVGNTYWHKGKYRAALQRYEFAAKSNPSSAKAYFKVGEAEEKLKNADAAKIAFQKVIKLAPDSKLAQEAKKKLGLKG